MTTKQWIWENPDYPKFTWDKDIEIPEFPDLQETEEDVLAALTANAIASSNIENEWPVWEDVYAMIADIHAGKKIDILEPFAGMAKMTYDSVFNADKPFDRERLCTWHKDKFPTGYSGVHQITVGKWREHGVVVGNAYKVFYEAPPAYCVDNLMLDLFDWVEGIDVPNILKAGIAHVWFEQIHPFDDGNGRTGRALMDLLLARAGIFHLTSEMIWQNQQGYYRQLQYQGEYDELDLTLWLEWFLDCVIESRQNYREKIATRRNLSCARRESRMA